MPVFFCADFLEGPADPSLTVYYFLSNLAVYNNMTPLLKMPRIRQFRVERLEIIRDYYLEKVGIGGHKLLFNDYSISAQG